MDPLGVDGRCGSVWGIRKANLKIMGLRTSSANEAGLQNALQRGLPCRGETFPEFYLP